MNVSALIKDLRGITAFHPAAGQETTIGWGEQAAEKLVTLHAADDGALSVILHQGQQEVGRVAADASPAARDFVEAVDNIGRGVRRSEGDVLAAVDGEPLMFVARNPIFFSGVWSPSTAPNAVKDAVAAAQRVADTIS